MLLYTERDEEIVQKHDDSCGNPAAEATATVSEWWAGFLAGPPFVRRLLSRWKFPAKASVRPWHVMGKLDAGLVIVSLFLSSSVLLLVTRNILGDPHMWVRQWDFCDPPNPQHNRISESLKMILKTTLGILVIVYAGKKKIYLLNNIDLLTHREYVLTFFTSYKISWISWCVILAEHFVRAIGNVAAFGNGSGCFDASRKTLVF